MERALAGNWRNPTKVCCSVNSRANAATSVCPHGWVRCGHLGKLGEGRWGLPVRSLLLRNCQEHLSRVLPTSFSQGWLWPRAVPGSAWPQHENTFNCHEEDRTQRLCLTYPGNMGTKPGVATANPAVTLLMRGQQTSEGAERCGPQSGCAPSRIAFGWVQATDCGCFAQSFSYIWLSA